MIRHLRYLLIAGLAILPLATAPKQTAAETCGDPALMMSTLGRSVIDILNQNDHPLDAREAQLAELLAQSFDLRYIAKLIIGPSYRSLDKAERAEYQELFSSYVLKTYATRLSRYSGQEFTVGAVAKAGKKDQIVSSTLQRAGGTPFKVDWRLRCRGSGLKIVDVVVEGVSMIVAQRNEFTSTLASRGLDGLLAILRMRIERAGASKPS